MLCSGWDNNLMTVVLLLKLGIAFVQEDDCIAISVHMSLHSQEESKYTFSYKPCPCFHCKMTKPKVQYYRLTARCHLAKHALLPYLLSTPRSVQCPFCRCINVYIQCETNSIQFLKHTNAAKSVNTLFKFSRNDLQCRIISITNVWH